MATKAELEAKLAEAQAALSEAGATTTTDVTYQFAGLVNAIRGLLVTFEAGVVNVVQREAIHAVRMIIGDAEVPFCSHESTTQTAEDDTVCDSCGQTVTSLESAPSNTVGNQEPSQAE